jgi:hypothetical protein
MGAEIGMLVVETIAKIRRAYFVHGQPIKAICRDLGVSRKVVRKVIRSEATEFRYEREAQPLPRIGPWSDNLDQLLVANEIGHQPTCSGRRYWRIHRNDPNCILSQIAAGTESLLACPGNQ